MKHDGEKPMTTDTQVKRGAPVITPAEFKWAREQLGLTLAELAVLLDTDPKSLRCIEAPESTNMHRKPAPRMVRLLDAYMMGYRPSDWPTDRQRGPLTGLDGRGR
jgi:DNA-binding transcriptional regulator YiaG